MATTVVSTIGSGQDYSTIQAWEDAAPANLVSADQVWKGVINSASFNETPSGVLTVSGSTSDSTRYKWLTVADGCSFVDNLGTNPLRLDASYGALLTGPVITYTNPINFNEAYFRLERLQIASHRPFELYGVGANVDSCVFRFAGGGLNVENATITNSLIYLTGTSGSACTLYDHSTLINCTVAVESNVTNTNPLLARASYTYWQVVKNCALFSTGQAALPTSAAFTNSFTDRASPPSGCTTVAYDTTTGSGFVSITPGAPNFKLNSTSALVNSGTSSGAPATDISGAARPSGASYDVGAFEFVAAGGTTNAGITQADGADTTALAVTVTTGAAIGAVDAADTQIITAANWTTAQLSGSIGADTTTITATAGSVTNASIGQTDSGDATVITAANWTTALIAHGAAADATSIATAVTTGAAIATFDSADTTAITGNIVGVTSASVAVTDAADAQAIATLVTTGAVIVGTDGADSALAAAACWTTAILGASDAWDVTGITGSVAPGTAIYPLAADVRLGITYGPTGADYVGTLTGGGPSAADIAAAVWSYTQ